MLPSGVKSKMIIFCYLKAAVRRKKIRSKKIIEENVFGWKRSLIDGKCLRELPNPNPEAKESCSSCFDLIYRPYRFHQSNQISDSLSVTPTNIKSIYHTFFKDCPYQRVTPVYSLSAAALCIRPHKPWNTFNAIPNWHYTIQLNSLHQPVCLCWMKRNSNLGNHCSAVHG